MHDPITGTPLALINGVLNAQVRVVPKQPSYHVAFLAKQYCTLVEQQTFPREGLCTDTFSHLFGGCACPGARSARGILHHCADPQQGKE